MALDEALLERAAASERAVFRVYTWAEPTLSFGRNQTARAFTTPVGRALSASVLYAAPRVGVPCYITERSRTA